MPAIRLRLGLLSAALTIALASTSAYAQKGKYDTGATDTEIKIGNIMPYSGPASAYGVIGKTEKAYFDKINAEGGINGRKINFISQDDGYSPPKTVEQARKLVESDEVLLIFNSLGTPPNAKIAVLYQNDDYGKDYLKGFKDGLGSKADSLIVASESYETTEPTIDSHIVNLKASGADVFFNITTPKFAAQAIKKNAEIGWKPLHFLNNVSASIGSVIKPAGMEASQDIISSAYLKDPTDPQWKDDPGMKGWNAFLDKYFPEADRSDASVMYAYTVAQGLAYVLKNCGDDLTRENIMKQAASIKNLELPGLLPGIKVNTSATDFAPISSVQLMKFKGQTWERFGEIISSDVSN